MSPWDLGDECLAGAARALVAATLAVVGGRAVAGALDRPRAWLALALLWLTPPILPGYAYATPAHVAGPLATEALYVALLAARGLPLAALVLALGRPRVADASRRCLTLAGGWRTAPRLWLRLQLGGPAGVAALAFGLVALQAFGEFEWSSLLLIEGWTVRLFDAQAGGLPLAQTLLAGALPLALQTLGLAGLLALALTGQGAPAPRPVRASGGWLAIGLAALVLQVVPGLILARSIAVAPASRLPIAHEIAASLTFATAAVGVAWPLAGALRGRALALVVPGLLGALPLGLLLLAAFTTPLLRPALDTPVPLLVAHVLLLLPVAVVLRHALGQLDAASQTTARLAGDARLAWRLVVRRRAAACGALFALAYLELTASTLLAPSRMTPVFRLLYNQAHYGHSAGLSSMIAAALAAPLGLLALALATRPLWAPVWSARWLEDA